MAHLSLILNWERAATVGSCREAGADDGSANPLNFNFGNLGNFGNFGNV